MSFEEKIEQIKAYDEDLAFKEADSLCLQVKDEKEVLEQRLDYLCQLQDESCKVLDKASLKYHSKITGILEVKGKLFNEYKYYYRAWTYLLTADYLYRSDMAEIAIDCYFRALIFQGNFEARDHGKLMFNTMQAILACYMKMNDTDTMNFILKDFDQKIKDTDEKYQKAYQLIRDYCTGGKVYPAEEDAKEVMENSFFKELVKEVWL